MLLVVQNATPNLLMKFVTKNDYIANLLHFSKFMANSTGNMGEH